MEWAPPDVSADDGPPPPTAARPVGARAQPPPPSLPALAPMTVSDILDGGFAILRRAPATIIGLTAVFVVPVQAVSAWLNRGAQGLDLDEVLQQTDTSFQLGDSTRTSGASAAVLQVGSMLALVFVAAAVARLVSAWHVGHDLPLGTLVRGSLARAWPLLASWVLVHVLEAVSIIGFGILPLAVMTVFLVTAPVIGAEGLGPIAAMRRSARLTSRRFWMVLGLALLSVLVENLFELAIGGAATVGSLFLGTEGVSWVLSAAVGIVTQLITIPVVAGITVLIYLDLRVRTEGLDLELEAIEAFPTTT